MTERRESDPTRIAQLLASEVTGRSRGPLGRLAVVDADPEATPSADGSLAYRLALEEAENNAGRSAPARTGRGSVTGEGPVVDEVSVAGEKSVAGEGTDRGEDSESERRGTSRTIGAVHLHQDAAVVSLPAAGRNSRAVALRESVLAAGERATPADRDDVVGTRAGGRLTVEVRTGAAVKPAVDVLTAVADSADPDPGSDDVPSRRD